MKMSVVALVAVVLANTCGYAATELEKQIAGEYKILTSDTWGGGHRIIFDFNGRKGWIVEPPAGVSPAPGKPWLWTMQWMGAYIERTGAPTLMQKGFHHVHLEAFDLRANDEGVKVFAEYQRYLVEKLGFCKQANLIGMSWGGFFSVRYAAAYPQNVAKIYLDAPLLNFQEFAPVEAPTASARKIGPWGHSQPKDGNWSADPRMPVNLAKPIAAAGIPVYLLYGGQDQTVKPVLNCELFIKSFQDAGGELKVEKRGLYGHHPHGFEHWDLPKIVDFFTSCRTER